MCFTVVVSTKVFFRRKRPMKNISIEVPYNHTNERTTESDNDVHTQLSEFSQFVSNGPNTSSLIFQYNWQYDNLLG